MRARNIWNIGLP